MKCKRCIGTGKVLFILIQKGRPHKIIETDKPCLKCNGTGKKNIFVKGIE